MFSDSSVQLDVELDKLPQISRIGLTKMISHLDADISNDVRPRFTLTTKQTWGQKVKSYILDCVQAQRMFFLHDEFKQQT